ncbi:MAG: hypothetical protein LBB18_04155 [Puniceicoccales bacterium]|jgi:pullulanase/glycogen debranching enzyme|nr:hypothetical protein [Puniceicoccales bacterium]
MVERSLSSIKRVALFGRDVLQVEYAADLNAVSEPVSRLKEVCTNEKQVIEFTEKIYEKYNFCQKYCYFSHGNDVVFALPGKYADKRPPEREFFLACKASDWGNAVRSDDWRLRELSIGNRTLLGLRIGRDALAQSFQFKFISSDGEWISPDDDTPNSQISTVGTVNFLFVPNVTGGNILRYRLQHSVPLEKSLVAKFSDGSAFPVDFTPWVSMLHSRERLGVAISENSTIFKIFAPRATSVRVAILSKKGECPEYHSLRTFGDGVWHVEIHQNLHRRYYYYQMLFDRNYNWGNAPMILDPYAKATVSSNGPGIILVVMCFRALPDKFSTPETKDLVILEAHLRDVVPRRFGCPNFLRRSTFSSVTKQLRNKNFYLRKIGVNCVELQPIQEFDYEKKEEYHWGYMSANWFSPASAYARAPDKATQIKEFQRLVSAFHEAGIAVILDVTYNHFGDSGHLYNIDSKYYFRHNRNGSFTNFSGCGNDFRTESPMAGKLVIDSLEHLLKTYNVDGFRFDLAELLGLDFLDILQKRLKSVKKTVILIAEPWSFRGNIGVSINRLPYSAWNDEYREFVKSYVLGNGNAEGLRYFLCGSLDFRSKFPSQSVNYVASHDDRGWVDNITENPHNDGSAPTENDRRRTRLSAAILMMSIGIPMIAEGQDFLSSKYGANNTYNRGDLNILNYGLIKTNRSTHEYFKKFIQFRLSRHGKILRLSDVPEKTYFKFFHAATKSACALMYNADKTFKSATLIFAINPHFEEATIDFQGFDLRRCRVLANEGKFFTFSRKFRDKFVGGALILPPMSCRLYSIV